MAINWRSPEEKPEEFVTVVMLIKGDREYSGYYMTETGLWYTHYRMPPSNDHHILAWCYASELRADYEEQKGESV